MNSDYSCSIYRSKDPVRNFKIKVTLYKSTGVTNRDDDEIPQEKELSKLIKKFSDIGKDDREETIVNWQTKIFSKNEYAVYSNPDFKPKNNLEEHYKEECLKLKERNYQPGRIFTYIDSDPYDFFDEIDTEVNTAPKWAIPPYLEKTKTLLKKRKTLVGNARSIETYIPRKDIVNYSPNDDEKKKFISKILPFQTMYIMADLSNENTKLNVNKQRVLCCIRIDSNGSIIVKPDFSRTPYFISTFGISRETFEYLLEHVSSQISPENLLREQKLHKELYLRHSEFIKNLVGDFIKMPEPGAMKVHVFGEIISAKNFDYDDLHVYYQLDLPRNWHVDMSAPISGFTQTSRTKSEGYDEIAYYSHPFEFDLYYKNDEINPEYRDLIPKMPKILFEVASYDSWNRYRTEGYAWTQIPNKTGMIQEELPCWRPRGDSIIYELRRFFIGGSPELEDISYVAIPSDHEGSILSRFGFRTTTTGSVKIRLNTIFQSQVFIEKNVKGKYRSQLLDRIGNYSSLNDMIAILEQFNLARNKMIEARENSKKYLD